MGALKERERKGRKERKLLPMKNKRSGGLKILDSKNKKGRRSKRKKEIPA